MRQRDSMIALAVGVISVVTMAIDRLFGTESEPGESWPVDPSAFVLSMALALALDEHGRRLPLRLSAQSA